MIKNLAVYSDNSRGVYRGISKEFFPKWRGWGLLYEGASAVELEGAVEEFYNIQFRLQLKLDLIEDEKIAFACLNFATSQGKKKLVSKLQKATNSQLQGTQLIEELNIRGTQVKLKLLLEFLDHYHWIGNCDKGGWVIETYRSINR